MKNYICQSQFEMFPRRGHFSKLGAHRTLLADTARLQSYQDAIKRVVEPKSIVLDIGTGTGILAFLAARAGADTIYAVECAPIIFVAKQLCKRNNLTDKVVLLHKNFPNIKLPQKVDTIITETIGFWGIDEMIVELTRSAKRKFGHSKTRIIPRTICLWCAPITSKASYSLANAWNKRLLGLDLSPVRDIALNNIYVRRVFKPEELLSAGKLVRKFILGQDQSSAFESSLEFKLERSGIVHGLAGWFDAELATGVTLSTSPRNPTLHWKHCFLPFEQPLKLAAGNTLNVTIAAQPTKDSVNFNWAVSFRDKCESYHDTRKVNNYRLAFKREKKQ